MPVSRKGRDTFIPKACQNIPDVPRRLFNLNSAARYVGISYWSLRTLLHNGELPFIRIGRRILVDHQDLDFWIDRNKRKEESF